jgi:hypothetical protein
MRRIKTLVGFALFILAALLVPISDRHQTMAASYTCKLTATCPGVAQCDGTLWIRTGDCSISCYKESGQPGEIVFNGSANCGTGSGGRPPGGGPDGS